MTKSRKHAKAAAAEPTPKPTKGEELFLVHLHRQTNEDAYQDHDFEPGEAPRKRSRSVGEELWEVHCKRSEGMPPDADDNEEEAKPDSKPPVKKEGSKRKANAASSSHEIHLRNRDVPPVH